MDTAGKKELRAAMRAKIKEAPENSLAESSEAVSLRVEALEEFRAARTVALYCAMPDEVSLSTLIGRWVGVKTLLLPVVEDGRMFFRAYDAHTPMRRGAFGIMEPAVGEEFPPGEIDLIVVPGMAFSRSGRRLGRGGGYYDRFLPLVRAYKAGVCFEEQLLDRIACEGHDVVMDAVVTPSGVHEDRR